MSQQPAGKGSTYAAEKVLVCFAVREEAAPFTHCAATLPRIQVLLTGMGARNAERAVRAALEKERPDLVITCGFAGGLQPEWPSRTVVFAVEAKPDLSAALVAAGARSARFHCAARVATTAAEKRELRISTSADAVEMESEIIHKICHSQNVPCATVRVILDTANEDLPLDFNRLMDAEQRLSYFRLALELIKSPGKIGALLGLQKQSRTAAKKLAGLLERILNKPITDR
jgi:adenosylhomocysteine nucleosidase